MANDKKYYWLKLKRDFFKRHDIQIIEDMPNGKDYILFYLKLLCESVDHEGNLRFSEEIPYNEQMLSSLTHTNIDIVRSAVKLFGELRMIDILDDGTLYMNQVERMIGSETYWAQKKREQREKSLETEEIGQIPTEIGHCPKLSNASPNCPSKSIETDKELEKRVYSNEYTGKKRTRFVPPTLEDVKAYCLERKNNVDAEKFIDYYTANGWLVGKNKMKDWKAAVRTWEKNGYDSKQGKASSSFPSSFDADEFLREGLRQTYSESVSEHFGKKGANSPRSAIERQTLSRAEEKAKNPPKTAAEDESIKERAEALRASFT